MKFKKLVIYGIQESALDPEYWQRIFSLADEHFTVAKDDVAILEAVKDADGLLVPFGLSVNQEIITTASNLKYIGILATAFDKVDVPFAKTKNIVVSNLGGYSTESVAEFVMAALLENLRQLEKGKQQARQGKYTFDGFQAREIKGKVFGVLGLGKIGRRVAELAQGFGADVRYWSAHQHPEAEQQGIKFTDLDTLISSADFLSLNLAKNDQTNGILNRERIKKLKPGMVVINTASMELVDINALAERLHEGSLTFILDHSDEMSAKDLKQLGGESIIIYPPIAFISQEARTNKQETMVGNAKGFLEGNPQNVVS